MLIHKNDYISFGQSQDKQYKMSSADLLLNYADPTFLGILIGIASLTYSGILFSQLKNETDSSQKKKEIGIGSGALVFGLLIFFLMLSIDRREIDLCQLAKSKGLIDSLVTIDGKMINGDLHIFKDVGKPIIILERKKVSDFRASLADSRWSQQRYRLELVTESSLPKTEEKETALSKDGKVVKEEEEEENPTKLQRNCKGIQTGYLFEASDKDANGNYVISAEDRKSIYGAIQNLQIEFGMLGFLTWGPKDTLDFCLQMNTKLPQYLEGRNIEISYVAHTKRSQISKNGYKTLLTTIEGISSSKADAIKEHYPTFKTLWKAWEESSNPNMLLADISIPKQKVKFGKVLSQRLCERYFYS